MDRQTLTTLAQDALSTLIRELAVLRAGIDRMLLDAIGVYASSEAWRSDGATSPAAWVCAELGTSFHTAKETVRVAGRLADLPHIADTYADGRLSWDQVRYLTSLATPDNEVVLARDAQGYSVATIARMAARSREIGPEDDRQDAGKRGLVMRWRDGQRMLEMRGRLPAEDGVIVQQALEAIAKRIPVPAGERVPWRSKLADALVDLARGGGEAPSEEPTPAGSGNEAAVEDPAPAGTRHETAHGLQAGGDAAPRDSRAQRRRWSRAAARGAAGRAVLVVHADASALMSGTGFAEIQDGPRISIEAALRLACDSSWSVAADDTDGRTIGIGRRSRSVPAWLVRTLKHRDRRCRFPGCEYTKYLHAHHIRHWARGGTTDESNLVLICPHHHKLVHEGGWSVVRGADGRLVFSRPDGTPYDPGPGRGLRAKQTSRRLD